MSIQKLPKGLIDDMTKLMHGEPIEEKKKLDPVGKADADIDNDGDTDSSDEYLKKRRAAIAKSMKDEEVDKDEDEKKKELVKEKGAKYAKYSDLLLKKQRMSDNADKTAIDNEIKKERQKLGINEGELPPALQKAIDKKKGKDTDDEKEVEEGKLPPALQKAIDKKNGKDTDDEKEVEETTQMSGKPEKKSIAQVRQDMQKSVKDANQKLKDAEMRKKEKLKTATDMKEHLMPLIEEHGIELVSTVIHNLSLLDLDEAGPMGSVGIRQDFKQDSNKDARVAAWKKKQAAMSGVERLQKKLEFARKQREVHDNAASKYREKASEIRDKNPDDRAADNYDDKADRQEEMGMDQHQKVQDIKDQIADMKGKK